MYILHYTSMLIFDREEGLVPLFLMFKGALPPLVLTPLVPEQKVKLEVDTGSVVAIVLEKACTDHPYCLQSLKT